MQTQLSGNIGKSGAWWKAQLDVDPWPLTFLLVEIDQTELFYWSTVDLGRRPSTLSASFFSDVFITPEICRIFYATALSHIFIHSTCFHLCGQLSCTPSPVKGTTHSLSSPPFQVFPNVLSAKPNFFLSKKLCTFWLVVLLLIFEKEEKTKMHSHARNRLTKKNFFRKIIF